MGKKRTLFPLLKTTQVSSNGTFEIEHSTMGLVVLLPCAGVVLVVLDVNCILGIPYKDKGVRG